MKILIIPSWYPHRENRTQGIFFLKQAELLARHHDIRVLIGKEEAVGYRKAPGKLPSLLGAGYGDCDFFLDELPTVKLYQFSYDDFVFLPEKKRFDRIAVIYRKVFADKIATDWKPDIIHAHDPFYGGLAALQISKAYNIPFVMTSHTPFQPGKWSVEQMDFFRKICSSTARLLTVSHFDRENLKDTFGSAMDSLTVGNYIDEEVFKPAPKKKHERFEFLCVTSTSTRKDFPTLFRALMFVKEKTKIPFFLNLPILEVNDGITMDDIKALISSEGLDEQIKMHTHVSIDNSLLHLYQKADLFISTSYHETFGVATAEAIACGTPVIAVDNGGIRDIVETGLNGFLVPKQQPEALAGYILKFMHGEFSFDPAALHHSIVSKFGSIVFLNRLDSIYEKVLNDQRN